MTVIAITVVDMHIRDDRVFLWLKSKSRNRELQISHERIAEEFNCHRNTAAAIIKRLEAANMITVLREGKRGGWVYRVNDEKTN